MGLIKWPLFCLMLASGAYAHGPRGGHDFPTDRCEPITIPLCLNMPYNRTTFPNLLKHNNQDEAGSEAHQYFPLKNVNCSQSVQSFLCSLFVPLCSVLEVPLPPCRTLCLEVKAGCEKLMKNFGFDWPDHFNCDQFPGPGGLCFGENVTTTSMAPPLYPLGNLPIDDNRSFMPEKGRDFGFVCPSQLKVPKGLEYTLRIGNNTAADCGAPCHGMFFTPEEVYIARNWIGAWSFLCLLSCLFTVLTYAIDPERFKYPERPIIFLSVCYLLVSIAYVVGFFSEESVSCRKFVSSEMKVEEEYTITQGTKHELCTILFMVLYFFNMASSIWWVVLTLTWFLAAGLKWGHEAIEANSQYFHMAAWGAPAIKTISLLAMRSVEGDILSGVCYVGIWNVTALRQFVLAPLTVYLVLGTLFLLAGFVSLFRIRTVMKHDGTKTDKLEKLMLRIGLFSVLYMVPAVLVIGCLFYEQNFLEQWLVTWHSDICRKYGIPCPRGTNVYKHKPIFSVFMVKYLMALIVGITSSVWVWSGKTVVSWTKFAHRIRGTRPQAYV